VHRSTFRSAAQHLARGTNVHAYDFTREGQSLISSFNVLFPEGKTQPLGARSTTTIPPDLYE